MVGDQPNILTTGVFERKELERYARGKIIISYGFCFKLNQPIQGQVI